LFSPLIEHGTILRAVFGLFIMLLAIVMFTDRVRVFIRLPQRLLAFRGYFGAFILGLSYTLIAAPCAIPIFLSAILIAVDPGSLSSSVVNLMFFSIGATLPFLVSTLLVLAAKDFLRNQYQAFAKRFTLLASLVLFVTGLLLFVPILGLPSILY
jgi:cytochrome c-type biogenesis protein